ncbi:MAG: hypothetical protein M0Z47_00155, partial [Actinomycetota bacterium]|nr:hypothetical protein [Actinomycetota bacterium]
ILLDLGFEITRPRKHGRCTIVGRGAECLYLHPMDFSGPVVKNSIPEIERALRTAKTFLLRAVDRYQEVRNYTEAEFRAALDERHTEIATKIIRRFTTKRRNLYVHVWDPTNDVKSGIDYIDHLSDFSRSPLCDIERCYINAVWEELLARGEILVASYRNGNPVYRARSPRDPR